MRILRRGGSSPVRRLRHFATTLEVEVSRAMFFSQSRSRRVIRDKTNAAFKRLRGKQGPISGRVETTITLDETRLTPSGWIDGYSWAYYEEEIPEPIHKIIERHRGEIESYLGKKFLAEPVMYYRTAKLPKELSTYDVYSNVWHQDSHDGNRLLKIFLLIEDVGEDDGPLHFLSEDDSRSHWSKLCVRWEASKVRELPRFDSENIFTGKIGDFLIVDTSRCMHRAGIPQVKRDMIQLCLFPAWCPAPGRSPYSTSSRSA